MPPPEKHFPSICSVALKTAKRRDRFGYISVDLGVMRKTCQTLLLLFPTRAADEIEREVAKKTTGDKIL